VSETVVLVLIPAIAGLFGTVVVAILNLSRQAGRDLVEDQRERIAMLTDERDELRTQVRDLEAKVRHHEGRPTRGKA
jgi:cell division protein FtsB